jgi:hypothetical protein
MDGKGGLARGRPFSLLGTSRRWTRLHARHKGRGEMGRNVTMSIGALILIIIVVAIIF